MSDPVRVAIAMDAAGAPVRDETKLTDEVTLKAGEEVTLDASLYSVRIGLATGFLVRLAEGEGAPQPGGTPEPQAAPSPRRGRRARAGDIAPPAA